MKKFWVNVGKAAAYFGAYFGGQMVVSFAVSLVLSTIVSISMIQPDGSFDMEAYMDKANAALANTMPYILIGAGILTILVFFIVAKIRKKKFTESASLRKFKPATVAPIVLGGIAFNFAISYLMNLIPFPQTWIDSYEASSNELLGNVSIALWISVVIMAPLVEELTFRGFMYTRLKQGMPKWIAVILTSLVFGIVHGTIIWAIYTFVFSLALIYIFERTKSIWACILFHMAFNLVGAVMSTWPEMLDNVNEWLIFGVTIVLIAGCCVWFILLTNKKKVEVNEEVVIEEKQTV
ncbi:MAG: CPBP family intramembrane metalloprotease [Lachnospiraceae bacterium]|nr:CPBP family intramembrane metalloprotease [Lachnospiraceae bacterium]